MHAPLSVSKWLIQNSTTIRAFNHLFRRGLDPQILEAIRWKCQKNTHLTWQKEVIRMRVDDEMSTVLSLTLNEAYELQRLARQYRSRQLTREQFIAAVEEISTKMVQRLNGSLCDIRDEDIPY